MNVEFKPTVEDIEEIKVIAGIDGDSKDNYVKTMLPLLMESVMAHTNNTFDIQLDGSLRIPGGVKIYLAKAIERNMMQAGLRSRSMGSVSYSYEATVPEELKSMLVPYKKVKFRAQR